MNKLSQTAVDKLLAKMAEKFSALHPEIKLLGVKLYEQTSPIHVDIALLTTTNWILKRLESGDLNFEHAEFHS